jgi:hypothetical protein
MIDRILAVLAITGLILFFAPIAWKVPAVPLLVLFVVIVSMAAFDFWREIRGRAARNRDDG